MTELKSFIFATVIVLEFKKIEKKYNKTKYKIFYSNSKVETIINEGNTYNVFQSIYSTIIPNIKAILIMYLNQFIVLLYQTYKNL